MYLKQIEIRGFKSFADKTVLKLFPGMTAVVGPNGCGKSNIVDAIRWVLGEQSAKALRGSSMQDVIFEGTEKRKGLPTAEVILTFTDCEKDLGTAFNEVEVSRRVTREGGSDYYINGKIVRLKDVQRLFANTGVGRVSYSFMLQGQIDQILSTNASERRTIFEEIRPKSVGRLHHTPLRGRNRTQKRTCPRCGLQDTPGQPPFAERRPGSN